MISKICIVLYIFALNTLPLQGLHAQNPTACDTVFLGKIIGEKHNEDVLEQLKQNEITDSTIKYLVEQGLLNEGSEAQAYRHTVKIRPIFDTGFDLPPVFIQREHLISANSLS